ncbi:MAG: hypothetical protein V1867_03485 [Candidatus Falkowbacteria bacterium]
MKQLLKEKNIPLKLAKKIIFSLIIIIVFDFFLFPAPVLAIELNSIDEEMIEPVVEEPVIVKEFINNLPLNENRKALKVTYRTITAYNSEKNQCDDSPCVTANGFNVCEHGTEDTIAANWLKFGTQVRIPDLFGDRIFTVRDRMNERYDDRVDIWMVDKTDAKKFGVRHAKIEILEP